MNLSKLFIVLAVGTALPTAAFAASVCAPLSTGTLGLAPSAAYLTAAAAVGGSTCNTIITLNANGTIAVTTPNLNPYDGTEDNYVGVVNLTSSAVSSLSLTGSNIFGFDGYGIDEYGIASNSQDPGRYGGSNAFFTAIVGNTGIVNFIAPIAANGGSSAFSLEEAPSAGSLTNIVVGGATPEPSSLILLGTGALGLAGSFRRRIINAIR